MISYYGGKSMQFYAEIVVREYGEQDRYEWVGPISVDDAETAEINLRERGDDVVRVVDADTFAEEVEQRSDDDGDREFDLRGER